MSSTTLVLHYYEAKQGHVVAVQVTGTIANLAALADWTGQPFRRRTRSHDASVDVPAVTGFEAGPGDWIVRYPDGRFERMSDDDFNNRYQRS